MDTAANASDQGRSHRLLPYCGARLFIYLAVLCAFICQPHMGAAEEPGSVTAQRAKVDLIRIELGQIETVLATSGATEAELQQRRLRLQSALDQLGAIIDKLTPRVAQLQQRLDQLGPKPQNVTHESTKITHEREMRTRDFADADEALKIARTALLQAEQIQMDIRDRRDQLFANVLFAPGPSLLDPSVWLAALGNLPKHGIGLSDLLEELLADIHGAFGRPRGLIIGLALSAAATLYFVRARYLPKFKARFANCKDDNKLHRVYIGLAHLLAGALPPALASWLIYTALNMGGMLSARVEPVIGGVVGGLVVFAFVQSLADATFAPAQPQRRVVRVKDAVAGVMVSTASALAFMYSVSVVLAALAKAVMADGATSALLRGLCSVLFALTLIGSLYRIGDEADEDGSVSSEERGNLAGLGPVRLFGWLIGVTTMLAALLGYVAFASFVTEQALWLATLACLFLLAIPLIEHGVPRLFADQSRLARILKGAADIKRHTLNKGVVVAVGVLKLVLILATLLAALIPWGLESGDFFSSLQAIFFGFQIGGITISLSSITVAALVYAVGMTATHSLKNWLEERFLPATQLDMGLRHSITTVAGYIGYLAAAALAISAAGLSLERLTLVASALSVGIGFGLQSVVSNFVSGLILLWERPIRVGDLVAVGDVEGIVKRIKVRSTEISTSDRSSVMVPNSNLISGVVRNRVRNDRSGRVTIALSVARTLDASEVRAMLSEVTASHGDVLHKPAPTIFLTKIGAETMDLEVICIVDDVDIVSRVTSDLNFAIHKRLLQFDRPAKTPELTVKGLGGLERSLTEIATAVAKARVKPPGKRQAHATGQGRQKE